MVGWEKESAGALSGAQQHREVESAEHRVGPPGNTAFPSTSRIRRRCSLGHQDLM
ncbi:MAG: hypothetical protein M3143_14215 [Actinomycetota bacterium]|nr:hypothetical protein [Actinomycetota bacterium]